MEVTGDGAASRFVFEVIAVKSTATGRVNGNNQTGTFRLMKAGSDEAAIKSSWITPDMIRQGFAEVSGWVTKAADLVPADMYSYRPATTVRTYGQLIGHIADGYNCYCGRASGQSVQWSDAIANGNTDKATLVAKLKQSLDACNTAYGSSQAPQLIANIAHTNLHYGNMVTYLRMLGLVPPSS
ncbi:MAG: DinB family protein [Longimicrobiales bacterium]